jgi:hypothetical protein
VAQSILTSKRTRPASNKVENSPAHHRPMNQAHCRCLLVQGFMGCFAPENIVTIARISQDHRQADCRADEQ